MSAQVDAVTRHYVSQWPRRNPATPPPRMASHLDLGIIHKEVSELFEKWQANQEYTEYCKSLQKVLDDNAGNASEFQYKAQKWHTTESIQFADTAAHLPTLRSLLDQASVPIISVLPPFSKDRPRTARDDFRSIESLLSAIQVTEDPFEVRYKLKQLLSTSLEELKSVNAVVEVDYFPYTLDEVSNMLDLAQRDFDNTIGSVQAAFGPRDKTKDALSVSGLWPRTSITALLKLLSSTSSIELDERWKICLVNLGMSLAALQRVRRLLSAVEKKDLNASWNEAENRGHRNWSVVQYPDWLLLEIDNDFTIRDVQV